jgi:hypothetical protein
MTWSGTTIPVLLPAAVTVVSKAAFDAIFLSSQIIGAKLWAVLGRAAAVAAAPPGG